MGTGVHCYNMQLHLKQGTEKQCGIPGSLGPPWLCLKEKSRCAPCSQQKEIHVHSLGESQAAPIGPSLGTISSDSPIKLGTDKRKGDFLIDHLFCITFPLCWKSEYCLGARKEIWLWEYGCYLNEELSCCGICGSLQIAVRYKTFRICTCTYIHRLL